MWANSKKYHEGWQAGYEEANEAWRKTADFMQHCIDLQTEMISVLCTKVEEQKSPRVSDQEMEVWRWC